MLLWIIRAAFLLVVAGLDARLAKAAGGTTSSWVFLFAGVFAFAVAVVVVDLLTPRKKIQTISGVYLGLMVGLILSNLIRSAVEPSIALVTADEPIQRAISGILMIIICYVCVSTILQTKDDFRFIIPYMEFSKEVKGTRRSSWTPPSSSTAGSPTWPRPA